MSNRQRPRNPSDLGWQPVQAPFPNTRAFSRLANDGEILNVICSTDEGSYHISISSPRRYPSWDEILETRLAFSPNRMTMAMILPPMEEYVNFHNNCFHLWEIEPDERY